MTDPADISSLRCWIVSESKAGAIAQCRGVAEKLGDPPRPGSCGAPIRPSPAGPAPEPRWTHIRNVHLNRVRPPWPDPATSCGRQAEPAVMAATRRSRGSISPCICRSRRSASTVRPVLHWPARLAAEFDGRDDVLRWWARAPRRRGAGGEPPRHGERRFGALPGRRAAVMTAAPTPAMAIPPPAWTPSSPSCAALQAEGCSLLVRTSRRSDPAVLPRLQQALAGDRGFVWDRTGENPVQYLAIADAVW